MPTTYELFSPIDAGDYQQVRALLEAGASPNDVYGRRGTPLHRAALLGHVTIVDLLLRYGAEVGALSNDAYYGSPFQPGLLDLPWDGLETGVEDERDAQPVVEDATPLHLAAFGGHTEVVRLLLDNGADPCGRLTFGYDDGELASTDALYLACWQQRQWDAPGDPELIVLLQAGKGDVWVAAMEQEGRVEGQWRDCCLSLAATHGKLELLQTLLALRGATEGRFPPDREIRSLLALAVDEGEDEVVRFLLAAGADPEAPGIDEPHHAREGDGLRPLALAASAGRVDLAAALLSAGADVHAASDSAPGYVGYVGLCHSDGPWQALQVAAFYGHAAVVRLLLTHGADALAGGEGYTALDLAVQSGHLEAVQVLLEATQDRLQVPDLTRLLLGLGGGSDAETIARLLLERGALLSVGDANGNTPLHLACQWDHPQGPVELFLAAGAHTEARNCTAQTPLHRAVHSREVVALLLEAGADPNASDDESLRPLHLAAELRQADVAQALLDAGAEADARDDAGRTPLAVLKLGYDGFSVGGDPTGTVAALLGGGADTEARNAAGETLLYRAATQQWERRIAELLLQAGADPEAPTPTGATALWSASGAGGGTEMIKLLLAHGADPNRAGPDGDAPLHRAVPGDFGECSVLTALLQAGADPQAENARGETPLALALRRGNREAAALLREHGARLRTLDEAVRAGDTAAVAEFLERGSDPSARDGTGQPLLHLAAQAGRVDLVELLLSAGAQAGATCDDGGKSALHLAVVSQRLHVARALLDNGANPNQRDAGGRTPLHDAGLGPELAQLLLERGALLMARDKQGNTPLHLAAHWGSSGTYAVLLPHYAGADPQNAAGLRPSEIAREADDEAEEENDDEWE